MWTIFDSQIFVRPCIIQCDFMFFYWVLKQLLKSGFVLSPVLSFGCLEEAWTVPFKGVFVSLLWHSSDCGYWTALQKLQPLEDSSLPFWLCDLFSTAVFCYFNSHDFGRFKEFDVCFKVTLIDAEDGMETV